MRRILTSLAFSFLGTLLYAQCDAPSDLSADNITDVSADLSWSAGGDEVYWGLEWGNDGFLIGDGTRIDSLEESMYLLEGLNAETSYDYYVWAICDGDTSSVVGLEFNTRPKNNFTCSPDTIIVGGDTLNVNNIFAEPFGPQASCWGNHQEGDLWYIFELTEPMAIEIGTEAGTSNDSHIALYSIAVCDDPEPSYTELYCSEDISNGNWMSMIETSTLDAGFYYIQCGTWTNSIGNYDLWVTEIPPIAFPPNDICIQADTVVLVVNGDTLSVTGDGTNATDENQLGAAHVWEAFTIDTCADVRIDFCGSDPVPSIIFNSLFDECGTLTIASDGELINAACEDDANQGMFFSSLGAGTYYYPVVADALLGGFGAYTMNISAVTCEIPSQPDTCMTWVNGPYGDFNQAFGGAPSPDSTGTCPIYTLDAFSIYASESYDVFNFEEGLDYAISVCEGDGAGTWPVELAVLDTAGNIIAWAESCLLTFTAPYSGTMTIGINEAGACGESSDNLATDNGFLSISCGGVVPGVEEVIKDEFTIYPNPNSGSFFIVNQGSSAQFTIECFDPNGRMIHVDQRFISEGEQVSIQLTGIDNGMYFIRLYGENNSQSITKRIIIQ